MFKRANKVTALLLAGAAFISLVPAYASDVKKIESEDGTVYNAVAYKDGKFYIDGEVNDKDEAAYYVANGKYNNLSDVDSGCDVSTYGTKYVDINDGDYFVDLTSGKVTDDSIAEDARDDAASNLRRKVKADTDGRYIKDQSDDANAAEVLKNYDSTTASAVTITTANQASKIYSIPGNKFGEEWFATAFKNDDKTNGLNEKSGYLNVYTDGNGKYIDADFNIGKIKVETTTGSASKIVYLENTDDDYDTASSGKVYSKVSNEKVIGQDKDYIYRFAKVTVYTSDNSVKISEIYGQDVDKNTASGVFTRTTNGSSNEVSFRALQKISKAQSSNEAGGVKYAKTAYTYILSDNSNTLKKEYGFETNYDYFTIADGKVTGYKENSDNVDIQTATLKSENGLYYLDLGSASTGDDVEALDNKLALDVDADGNIWRLNGGYLYEWDNDEDWNKVYKVDGSFNKLSVYDKNNIVAWNQDDEVYSIIGKKKVDDTPAQTTPATTTPTPSPAPVVSKGWIKAADGSWNYNKADGTKAIGWLQDGGAWYYLKSNGAMATGWINDNGTWYYLNPVYGGPLGAMKTGWINDNGTWYYCNASGAMKTGWINDNGTWYYCNSSGAMLANTIVDGYKLGSSGAWIK